jgi:hypothetical protein
MKKILRGGKMKAEREIAEKNVEDLDIFAEEKVKLSLKNRLILYSPCAAFIILMYFMSDPNPDLPSYLLSSLLICITYVTIVHTTLQNCRQPKLIAFYIVGGIVLVFLMSQFLDDFPFLGNYQETFYELSVVAIPVLVLGYIIYYTWKEHNRNGLKRHLPSQSSRLKLSEKTSGKKVRIISDVHKRTFSEREPEKYGELRELILLVGLPFSIIGAISIPYIFNFTTDHNYMIRCVLFLICFIGGVCLIRPVSRS